MTFNWDWWRHSDPLPVQCITYAELDSMHSSMQNSLHFAWFVCAMLSAILSALACIGAWRKPPPESIGTDTHQLKRNQMELAKNECTIAELNTVIGVLDSKQSLMLSHISHLDSVITQYMDTYVTAEHERSVWSEEKGLLLTQVQAHQRENARMQDEMSFMQYETTFMQQGKSILQGTIDHLMCEREHRQSVDSTQKGQLAELLIEKEARMFEDSPIKGQIDELLRENHEQRSVIASQREQINRLHVKVKLRLEAFDKLYAFMCSKIHQ